MRQIDLCVPLEHPYMSHRQGCSWCAGYVGAVGDPERCVWGRSTVGWSLHSLHSLKKVTTSTSQTHQEVVKTLLFGGSPNRQHLNEKFGEDTNFTKLLTQPKRSLRWFLHEVGWEDGNGQSVGNAKGIGGIFGGADFLVLASHLLQLYMINKGNYVLGKSTVFLFVWQFVMCHLSKKMFLEMVKSCHFRYTYNSSPDVKETIDSFSEMASWVDSSSIKVRRRVEKLYDLFFSRLTFKKTR